jgi:photosystem II stability/assembly factor-like uncharacterized protein
MMNRNGCSSPSCMIRLRACWATQRPSGFGGIYAGAVGPVGEWTSIGPITIGPHATGVLFSVAIEPSDPNAIYAASHKCGVWKSETGGGSWWPVGDTLPSLAVAALAVDPSAPGRVYAALNGPAVYRSDDGGATWGAIAPPPGSLPVITDLIVDPTSSQVLFVRGKTKIFRSGDAGASWQVAKTVTATSLVLDSTQPTVLYAGVPTAGVLRTTDGGVSGEEGWTNITAGIELDAAVFDVTLALTGADPQTIYLRVQRKGEIGTVYRSTDGGGSWSKRSEVRIYTSLIAADAEKPNIVYLAGDDFYRSTDSGAHWSEKSDGDDLPHVDHHFVVSDPTDPATIYTACDGGLYRSRNRGDDWEFASRGLESVLFYDLAISVKEPNVSIGGTQDNGTALTDGSSKAWRHINGGDGGTVAIDPTNANVMYAMNQGPTSLVRSGDHGSSFHEFADGLEDGDDCFNFHFDVHPLKPNILLGSCDDLWWRTSGSTPWERLFATPDGDHVLRSAVEALTDTYFAATEGGKMYAGKGGTNWQLAFEHPSGARCSALVLDRDDPRCLYAAFDGDKAGRVYRLRGPAPGALPLTATDITGGLPVGLAVQTLAVDAMTPHTIYAGTNSGVYRGRGETGVAWASYSVGMPPADVRALRVHPTTGVMRAGTFGRGAYEVFTDSPVGSVLATVGRITFLRAHDAGGFGRPPNFLDAEIIVLLDTEPWRAFGLKLRSDAEEATRREMLALLRSGFVADRPVRIDYVRTAPRVGEIIRVANR